MPAMPIAEMSAPMVVGIRHTSSAISTGIGIVRSGIVRKRLQRHDDQQEDQREHGQQDVQRDFVRGLLPFGALDQRDHAVQERVPRIGGDAHFDPVRNDPRAAGHGRPVAARFANDRRRFAGDRRLVDRRDAFDDLAVGRDEFAGVHHDHVVLAEARRRHLLHAIAGRQPVRHRFGPRLSERVCLRLAAALRHRLGEVGEQDREPQPEGDLSREERPSGARRQFLDEDDRREEAADLDDEHHRVLDLNPGIELPERIHHRLPDDARIPNRNRCVRVLTCTSSCLPARCRRRRPERLVEGEVQFQHIDARPAQKPERRRLGVRLNQLAHALDGHAAGRRDPRRPATPPRPAECADPCLRRWPSPSRTAPGRPSRLPASSRRRAVPGPPSDGRGSTARSSCRRSTRRCSPRRTAAAGSTRAA